jgi:hypothetical protein
VFYKLTPDGTLIRGEASPPDDGIEATQTIAVRFVASDGNRGLAPHEREFEERLARFGGCYEAVIRAQLAEKSG